MSEKTERTFLLPQRSRSSTKLIKDLFSLTKSEKKWWLLPFFIVILFIAALLVFVALTGPLAPFIYPIL